MFEKQSTLLVLLAMQEPVNSLDTIKQALSMDASKILRDWSLQVAVLNINK